MLDSRIGVALAALALAVAVYSIVAVRELQRAVDARGEPQAQVYRPGFGEFMAAIQAHHAKLWFAGTHGNWDLVAFELHEIMELGEDIQAYQSAREESALMDMLLPSLERLQALVESRDGEQFEAAFTELTAACNACHEATNYSYIRIRVPAGAALGNQVFAAESPRL